MKSKILAEDHQDLIKLSQAMTPEERLLAFYNHSRLVHQLYQAGEAMRSRSSRVKIDQSSPSHEN